ncbi:MAG TPA: polyamine aminopropyltransferase [Salinivirga sp.]|uniref:polyamine aminopropyltransferase n=1 Tax=Salinivirga sp. TaxID=1970192 RepID=UPI002B497E69|nr:polyamine aminopropyltransferase [Salinivirga sp.]HKK58966.1 polyamine aminopropyltransferase [Salinivirga sp.]
MESLGRHILVEFTGCDPDVMDDVQVIEEQMVEAAEHSGATIINSTFHHFSPLGVSGVIVIQESHLAIHTWPEYKYAAVDLFTCGDTVEPWVAFEHLKKAFKARNYSALEMRRGTIRLLDSALKLKDARLDTEEKVTPRFKRNIWFTDRDNYQALSLRYTGNVLFDERSAYNRIRVIETYAYGKALTSGNRLICTEKDEYHYHEMIAHPVMMACQNIERVLILGGGDGGSAREVLKHGGVKHVDLVEIDEKVVEASKNYLPFLSKAYDDERLNLIIGDALEFVENNGDVPYDLIIIDGPHSSGKPSKLYTPAFFDRCRQLLSSEGAIVVQGESPKFNEKAFKQIDQNLKQVFGIEHKFNMLFNVPTFPSGIWSFQVVMQSGKDPRDVDQAAVKLFVSQKRTRYYNYATHMAAFAMPEYVKKMLN